MSAYAQVRDVEDDAFQREVLADAIKDDGFKVVECTTAEAAELIVTSSGPESQALVTDQNLVKCLAPSSLNTPEPDTPIRTSSSSPALP